MDLPIGTVHIIHIRKELLTDIVIVHTLVMVDTQMLLISILRRNLSSLGGTIQLSIVYHIFRIN